MEAFSGSASTFDMCPSVFSPKARYVHRALHSTVFSNTPYHSALKVLRPRPLGRSSAQLCNFPATNYQWMWYRILHSSIAFTGGPIRTRLTLTLLNREAKAMLLRIFRDRSDTKTSDELFLQHGCRIARCGQSGKWPTIQDKVASKWSTP